MSIKSRLSRLHKQTGSGFGAVAATPASSNLRERLTKINKLRLHPETTTASQKLSDEELAERLKGSQIAEGVIQIQRRIPLTQKRGKFALTGLRNVPLLPGEIERKNQRCMYIDTETTGLNGGSGTLAFLIGAAFIEQDAIELRQLLLTRFSGESALLSTFSEILSNLDKLVSYNGKSYDLPLLMTRFRMQSLPFPWKNFHHLDLLHPMRRLFSKYWIDCRLTTLEENLLCFKRVNDLPGAEAPAAWFTYLRHGFGTQLLKVVEHNRQDIISLAAAHIALVQAIEKPRSFGVDLVALARWVSDSDKKTARMLLDSHADLLCNDGKRLLADLCKRCGKWSRAIKVWETLAINGCAESAESLAKYHEHISKDIALAHYYCEMLPAGTAQAHRLNRLNEKLELDRRKNAFLSH